MSLVEAEHASFCSILRTQIVSYYTDIRNSYYFFLKKILVMPYHLHNSSWERVYVPFF